MYARGSKDRGPRRNDFNVVYCERYSAILTVVLKPRYYDVPARFLTSRERAKLKVFVFQCICVRRRDIYAWKREEKISKKKRQKKWGCERKIDVSHVRLTSELRSALITKFVWKAERSLRKFQHSLGNGTIDQRAFFDTVFNFFLTFQRSDQNNIFRKYFLQL